MVLNLESGTYRIVSCAEGNPLGISFILPGIQFVHVNGPVQQWVVRKQGDGKYLLSIGGYPYTGVIDNRVVASINLVNEMAWEITYRKHQRAYTIARVDDPGVGWTMTEDMRQVEIQPIKETHSLPPKYATGQLFKFEQYQ